VNSQAAREDLAAAMPGSRKKIEVLPNCINLKEFKSRLSSAQLRRSLGLASSSIVVGALANLRPEKDLGTFLLAALAILKRFPTAEFLLIGDGPEANSLKQFAGDLGILESVHFLRDRSDVPDLLATLDILILSSYTESFPNAILEAMAMGKPVVATNVGGVSELVWEGQTGYLVPPKDPEAIAERVLGLCQDPARRLQMGKSARLRVESEFSVSELIKRLERFYTQSLDERCAVT